MNTPEGQFEHRENQNLVPFFDELVSIHDATDMKIQMSYVKHIEKPTSNSSETLRATRDELEIAYFGVTRMLAHGDMGSVEERGRMAVQIIDKMIGERNQLFSEYASVIIQSTEEMDEIRSALTETLRDSLSDSAEHFVNDMAEQFYDILNTDARVVNEIIEDRMKQVSARNIGRMLLAKSGEVAKIGAGVALGVIIADRVTRRRG